MQMHFENEAKKQQIAAWTTVEAHADLGTSLLHWVCNAGWHADQAAGIFPRCKLAADMRIVSLNSTQNRGRGNGR